MGLEAAVAAVMAAFAAAAVAIRSRKKQALLLQAAFCFIWLQMGRQQNLGWYVTPRPQQLWVSYIRPDTWEGANDADYPK